MNGRVRYRHHGYALLLMLVVLMGIGGVVATGFTKDAKQKSEAQRFLHNQRVLEQAKRALLMYAYNYSINNPDRGPGRMPCPDTDNDGIPETPINCDNGGPLVGRFPWRDPDINLNDIRDASGQRLWYAVSRNFATNQNVAADVINPDTQGTITIHDQSGSKIFDNFDNGVAAVIIAPGPRLDRAGVGQDRSIANADDPEDTAADTDPGIVLVTNYLDRFGIRDNADFDNTPGSDNGFILGPIRNQNGDIVINDQFILVTAEEVTQMAQRAVLDEYRRRIDQWQVDIWGANVNDYRYPWLNDYDDIANLEVYRLFPGGAGVDTVGRLPYMNYYQDRDSHTLITNLVIDYNLRFNLADLGPDGGNYLNAFNAAFSDSQLVLLDANLSFLQEDWANTSTSTDGTAATMVVDENTVAATVAGGATETRTLYFWDGCATCDDPNQDGWELCALPATSPGDCAKENVAPYTAFVPFTGNWADHADIRIRFVTLQLDLDEEFEIGIDPSQATVVTATTAPSAGFNATQRVEIAPLVTDLEVAVEGVGAADDIRFVNVSKVACEQDNFVGDNYNVPSFNPDASSYDCFTDLTLNANPLQPPLRFEVTADFFPELPVWVRSNRWNDSILMAYANDLRPGTLLGDCAVNPPCLTINNDYAGSSNNTTALLIGANNAPANAPDLVNIFEGANNAPTEDAGAGVDVVFEAHPPGGDDTMQVLR